jgi:hypothetical protein
MFHERNSTPDAFPLSRGDVGSLPSGLFCKQSNQPFDAEQSASAFKILFALHIYSQLFCLESWPTPGQESGPENPYPCPSPESLLTS